MQDAPNNAIRQSEVPSDVQHTTADDMMDPARANAFLTALAMDARVKAGEALPPFFHQLYFWEARPPLALGRDGHPKTGGLIPDMGLPRRMWAGGRLEFLAPLRVGESATKTSRLHKKTRKEGRSGPLGFVTLCHEIHQAGTLRVREYQDLVYRNDPSASGVKATPPEAPSGARQEREIGFDTTLLFRYSALTFNGHRIHYDLDYARGVEGYGGLVVHGPLLAQLLMLFAADVLGELAMFSFRATAPLIHTETVTLCWDGADGFWGRAPDGRMYLTATAAA